MSKIGREIITALRELNAVARSGEPLGDHFTIRTYAIPPAPSEFDGPAIRDVRERYGMSQALFAGFLCVSIDTVRSWEQGRRKPSPIARRLLDEMLANPDHYRARFAEMAAPIVGSAEKKRRPRPASRSAGPRS
jgi:putative transcriptional regulator